MKLKQSHILFIFSHTCKTLFYRSKFISITTDTKCHLNMSQTMFGLFFILVSKLEMSTFLDIYCIPLSLALQFYSLQQQSVTSICISCFATNISIFIQLDKTIFYFYRMSHSTMKLTLTNLKKINQSIFHALVKKCKTSHSECKGY